MCVCIGTNYSAISEPILFIFGILMHPYVPHIVLKFQINISNSF